MRSSRAISPFFLLALLILASAGFTEAADTPLALAAEGTLTQQGAILPWPADPNLRLALDVTVHTRVTAASPASNASAELIDYFNAVTADSGFVVSDPSTGPMVVGWRGRWTNSRGFLLQGDLAGRRVSVVSQTPPVVGLEGTAEIRGLSGRGRGLAVKASWTGQLNAQTGALRLQLTGAAAGDLGPPPVVCGEYTDDGLAGDIQPLMKRPDGSVNQDHFSHNTNDPYPHPFPYSTNPPTSGPHNPSPLPEGIYDAPQDDESLVHNLEHGHVIVTYRPSVAPAVVTRLRAVVGLYPEDVLLVPRPANDAPIALVSWGRLLKMTEYDEPAVQNFIDRNRGHGPECFH